MTQNEQNERLAVAETNIKNLEGAVNRVFGKIEKMIDDIANIVADKIRFHEESEKTFRNEIQTFKKKIETQCETCPRRFAKLETWQLQAKTWISVLVTIGIVIGSIAKWILAEIIKIFT